MRNAVKNVGRLAKEKSRTAYREVRSKFKDMQIHRELEGASYSHPSGNGKLHDKPRSAPSSPKFSGSDMSGGHRRAGVSSTLTHQLNSNFLDRNHSLRRCETSVSQHYHVGGTSPGFPTEMNRTSSSSGGSSDSDDELNMTPLNLNLMDDMKDILARTSSSATSPPAVDRSVSTGLVALFFDIFLLVFDMSFCFGLACLHYFSDGEGHIYVISVFSFNCLFELRLI